MIRGRHSDGERDYHDPEALGVQHMVNDETAAVTLFAEDIESESEAFIRVRNPDAVVSRGHMR
jgi:hypothetical protein